MGIQDVLYSYVPYIANFVVVPLYMRVCFKTLCWAWKICSYTKYSFHSIDHSLYYYII